MTFLPVAERELRVSARKRGSYLLRTISAALALFCGASMSLPYLLGGVPAASMGTVLFNILTWSWFLACLSCGLFFTSDCISQEKREGTLGFLFLTDLRGVDVLFGKLCATSLRAAYAMLAVVPVLAIPLLMGGVEAAQFWKSCLATLSTVVCSLAAGMFVSTVSRSASRAFSGTLLLLVAWCALGPLLSAAYHLFSGKPGLRVLELLSPFSVIMAAQPGTRGSTFWSALLLNLLGATAMLALSSFLVRRTWQEGRRAVAGESRRVRTRGPRARKRLRKWLDRSPMIWLVRRGRRQADGVWVLAVLALGIVVVAAFLRLPAQGWIFWNVCGGLFSFLLFVMVAAQAPRMFIEARQNGIMELLLSTPLRAEEMVSGHWRAQVRMFGPPVVLYLLAHGIGTALASSHLLAGPAAQVYQGVPRVVIGLGIGVTSVSSILADIAALAWFGMWMGMTSRSTNMAALKAIVFVQVVPAFAITVLSGVITMLMLVPLLTRGLKPGTVSATIAGGTFTVVALVVPLLLRVAKDAFFIAWSRKKLHRNFRIWAARVGQSELAMVAPPVIAVPPVIRGKEAASATGDKGGNKAGDKDKV